MERDLVAIFLEDFFDAFDVFFRSAGLVAEPADHFFIMINQEDGWEALNIELFGEFAVLGLNGIGLLATPGEVGLEEDEIIFGIGFEGLLGENFIFESYAPTAPIGAGEIDQHGLIGLFGGFFSGSKVLKPAAIGGKGWEGEE